MSRTEDSFQVVLLETVEKTLLDVLGEKVTSALRFYVDLKTAVRNPDRFTALIAEIVGPTQSDSLRKRVLEVLYEKFGLVYQPSGAKFSEEIASLKSRLSR